MYDFGSWGGKKLVSGNPMTTDLQKWSTTEPRERQNPLILVDPLKIEIRRINLVLNRFYANSFQLITLKE